MIMGPELSNPGGPLPLPPPLPAVRARDAPEPEATTCSNTPLLHEGRGNIL